MSRALDVGCGPGGVTFELARGFSEVVGLDYSQVFIDKCQELKLSGQGSYWFCTEGSLKEEKIAVIDPSIVSSSYFIAFADLAGSLQPKNFNLCCHFWQCPWR